MVKHGEYIVNTDWWWILLGRVPKKDSAEGLGLISLPLHPPLFRLAAPHKHKVWPGGGRGFSIDPALKTAWNQAFRAVRNLGIISNVL